MVSILKGIAGAMQFFTHDGFDLAFIDQKPQGGGEPVLLIHGFASTHMVNWVSPGWVKTLNDAGYRAIAFDNRGHGASSKSYEPADYTPQKMAGDASALLDHLNIGRAHVMGYSMGARISAFLALAEPEKVATLVFGGLGIGMVDGVGDWDPIADALLADDPADITHPRGKMFRAFADQTKSDRRALAACIMTSRTLLTEAEVARIVAADAGRRRHEGRRRRLARRAGAADAKRRKLFHRGPRPHAGGRRPHVQGARDRVFQGTSDRRSVIR